ncbi:MAG: secretin and TonB N-terminal domain-containing protein [Candidatus Omnitrophica bacterium]|nr:secretin and TonB N-terminal domain-containing protein [Candidatus Omnitrophota bacterium]
MSIRLTGLALCVFIMSGFGPIALAQGAAPPQGSNIEYLEFREVDIKDILRQLAKQYDLNIVFSAAVKGLVTVQLSNVTIDQALDSVVTINGFAYTKKGNVYKVTSQDEAAKEGKQTKLFRLNNADASKLKDTLAKVLSPEGVIEADVRSNSIIVTDTVSAISRIDAMLPSLDELIPQVLIEAKLIETSLTNYEKLGIDWTTTITASGSKRPITFPFDPRERTESPFLAPNTPGAATLASPYGFPYATAADFTLGTLDFSSFQMVLNFLRSRSNTKLVASPRIVTVNNQKAKINVGQVIPIATYERDTNTGNWEITGWEEQNVGVNLEVTPQISPDGHIKLQLKPEVSNIIDYIGEGENQRPVTSSRTAETEVIVKDGDTVVIGGLVKEKESKTVKKVPFLGDIPFIGKLFTNTDVGSDEEPEEKTDLLIFVTATLLKDKTAAQTSLEAAVDRPFKTQMRGVDAKK